MSHLDLHCLQRYIFSILRVERFKALFTAAADKNFDLIEAPGWQWLVLPTLEHKVLH